MSDRCSTAITSSLQTMQQDMIGQWGLETGALGCPAVSFGDQSTEIMASPCLSLLTMSLSGILRFLGCVEPVFHTQTRGAGLSYHTGLSQAESLACP